MSITPDIIGSYQIIKPLGEGGMGVVYEARHLDTGMSVALKTVRILQLAMLQSIRREIRGLAHIRHPGIVQIFDEGVHNGIPWYTMELIKGETLDVYCAKLSAGSEPSPIKTLPGTAEFPDTETADFEIQTPVSETSFVKTAAEPRDKSDAIRSDFQQSTPHHNDQRGPYRSFQRPLSPEFRREVLALIHRLCITLSYLHGEGFVHRDLKPENIFVRPGGLPVLVDFGLMLRFTDQVSREKLVVERGSAGTMLYMSPEQIRGEIIDARTDLYALGCIIYKLLTGRTPFVGDSVSQIIYAHLYGEVYPPSQLSTGISDDLDNLICRLLEKEPCERLGHADDVAYIVQKLGIEDELIKVWPKPRAYLYKPGLAGREEQLKILRALMSRLEDAGGGLFFLGGESGIGKTRLVMEFGKQVFSQNVWVLTGECQEEGSRPLDAFLKPLQMIVDRCHVHGIDEIKQIFGPRGKILALYEQSITSLPGLDAYPEPVELPAAAARLRLFSYLAETLQAVAHKNTLLLILDDLHWADDLTLEFLEFLKRSSLLSHTPLQIVGTYRSEEVSKELQQLIDSPHTENITLQRLETKAVTAVVEMMLSLAPAPKLFCEFLAHHSEGNPFFISEYLRIAVQEGLLARNEQGQWQLVKDDKHLTSMDDFGSLPIPKSLLELVSRRLRSLSENASMCVKGAAVIGHEINMELLTHLIALTEEELLDATQELLYHHVLEKIGADTFRFAHSKIREV
ncbi:AAA family ATPase, partial [candidate division CSSED10-310 bacterium]